MKGIDIREQGDGVTITVQVRPRARPGIELTDAGLVIKVASPPEKGRATQEARLALAEALGVPPSTVSLRTGRTARRKTFTIERADVGALRERLLRLTG